MRELLIGYLIGALEPEEHTQVEQSLANDAALRGELQMLDRSLGVLREQAADAPPETFAPLAGLATRTCERVAEQSQPKVATVGHHEPRATSVRGWSMLDYAVAAAVLIAAGLLVLPAINQSRFHARVLGCQDNLRQVGRAFNQYADTHQGSFPEVLSGDFAGEYGPELVHASLIDDGRKLVCPNSPIYESGEPIHWPTRQEIDNATPEQLKKYRDTLRHAYGYSVGYENNGRHLARRNEHDKNYALAGDAPSKDLNYVRSGNHGGCGQNVLFEDGHVRYLKNCHVNDDHLFQNTDGKQAHGTHPLDSVILPADYLLP